MEWFNNLDIKLQAALISSFTTIVLFFLGWLFRAVYERNSLNYKLKKEYQFEQKKKLKEEIAKNKIHLLNAAEELNHRLWNFSQHVGENWHSVPESNWNQTEQYYIKSFVYRFLKFLFWTLKTEADTISVDTTIADSDEILYLKFIKTFKDFFTDVDLLEELGYDKEHNTNHFFKNDLQGYCKFIASEGEVLSFEDFKEILFSSYNELRKVIEYFSSIEDNDQDKNLNVLRCCHLVIIQFLNKFGHDYQQTNSNKIDKITKLYKPKIMIKIGFSEFIEKSKLKGEMKTMLKKIK